MGKDDNTFHIEKLQKTTEDQANTIARLENDIKKLNDPKCTRG